MPETPTSEPSRSPDPATSASAWANTEPTEEDWSSSRRRAAGERARLLRERQDAEHRRAERIVGLFVRVAREEGLAPVPLRVRGYGGGSARTGLRGWYLRTDRSVGIDVEGHYYVLVQSLGLKEKLLGASPTAEPAPMTIGEGGRDGDIVPLRFALERLLPGWESRSPEPIV